MLYELAKDVYYCDDYHGSNVGVIRTSKGGLLIDTPMLPHEASQWQRRLYTELGIDLVYGVVNTDFHPESMFGNHAFMPTMIFGHEASAKPVAKYEASQLEQIAETFKSHNPLVAEELLDIEIVMPNVFVQDRTVLHMPERNIEILFLEGHTPASLGVWLPEEKILFVGDTVTVNQFPDMSSANTLAWVGTLRRIRELGAERIICSEGGACDLESIDALIEYMLTMWQRTRRLFNEGASRRECVDKVGLTEFFPTPTENSAEIKRRRRESIERVYTEIRLSERKR